MVEFPPFSERKRKKCLIRKRNCIYCRPALTLTVVRSFNLTFPKGETQMARSKRTSTILETARQRLAGLKSITENPPNFGPNLTVAGYEADITAVSNKLDITTKCFLPWTLYRMSSLRWRPLCARKTLACFQPPRPTTARTAMSMNRWAAHVAANANALGRKGREADRPQAHHQLLSRTQA